MNKLSFACAALFLATAACAAQSEGSAATSTSNIEADQGAEKDETGIGPKPGSAEPDPDAALTMEVEDLDDDGIAEKFTSRVNLCGTGGCTWTIHLSKLGEAGTVFAHTVSSLPRGSEDVGTSFFAYTRGGACYGRFLMMRFDGTTYQPVGDGIDCNEVINRPEGAPIAQFEYQCLSVTPPECRRP